MCVSEGEILVARWAPRSRCEVVRREYHYTYVRWMHDPDGPRLSAYENEKLCDLFMRASAAGR